MLLLHWLNGVDDFPLGEPVVRLFEGCPDNAKMRILYQLPQHVSGLTLPPAARCLGGILTMSLNYLSWLLFD